MKIEQPKNMLSKKGKVRRYAKGLYEAGKTVLKFGKAVVTEPFTNRYVDAQLDLIKKNPPASPRY
jgi:hypothetical protein